MFISTVSHCLCYLGQEAGSVSRKRYATVGHKTDKLSPMSPARPSFQTTDVRAGLQANLRLFISEAAQVFLAEPEPTSINEQVSFIVVHCLLSFFFSVPVHDCKGCSESVIIIDCSSIIIECSSVLCDFLLFI